MPVCLVTRVEEGVACTVYSIRHRMAGRLDICQVSLACLLGAWHTWLLVSPFQFGRLSFPHLFCLCLWHHATRCHATFVILYINRWRRCEIFLSLHTHAFALSASVIVLSYSYHRDYPNTDRACTILPWMCIRCGPGILTRRLRLESDARFSWEDI